jgi:uncharacterized RmlC-like cupin family protein
MRIINLRQFPDVTGTLTPIEDSDIPFKIRRVFTIHGTQGATRDPHAQRTMEEVIVAVAGSFDVYGDDANGPHIFHLCRPDRGLYVPPLTWRRLANFSAGAVAMVVASTPFDPEDYIFDQREFLSLLPPIGEGYFESRSKANSIEELWKAG